MAWKARVIRHIRNDSALRSVVEVGFWDNSVVTDPQIPEEYFHRVTYPSESLTTLPALQAAVIAAGQQARIDYDRVKAIEAALPVGLEITIP